jgi:3-oxoacyl-[acyl-carrier-protein] synthase-1
VRWHAPLWQGHAAVLAGVREAARLLEAGEAERVVVLGVDSLVTPESLAWLGRRRWLKTPDRLVGLMPGEAAGAVLLETERGARRRGAPVQGYVEAVAGPSRPGHTAPALRATRGAAVALPSKARAADREQSQAPAAPLQPQRLHASTPPGADG